MKKRGALLLALCLAGPVATLCFNGRGHLGIAKKAPARVRWTQTTLRALPTVSPGQKSFEKIKSVGSPVVHRYLRDDGEEWKMWFQGRDATIEEDVIKLSTGRIYRATSKDGLNWQSEPGTGALGCSLDVNEDEWWGFDTAHVGLGDVKLGESGKVMTTSGGVYTMYYFGGTYAKQPTSSLNVVPLIGEGAAKELDDVVGVDFRVGIALSQDGLNWSRLEGEHASGCALDVAKDDTSFDSVLVGWPQVVNHQENVFRMYFTTFNPASQRYSVGLATSEDSFKWSKMGLVFDGNGGQDEAAFDAKGVMRSYVVKNLGQQQASGGPEKDEEELASADSGTNLEEEEEEAGRAELYTMFYEGLGTDGRRRIGVASSKDGLKWAVGNGGKPVFEPNEDAAWEAHSVGSPYVVDMGRGALRLYYEGSGVDGTTSSIGCAECDDFIKGPANWRRVPQ